MNGYRKYKIYTVVFATAVEYKMQATIIEELTQKESILVLDRY